MPGSAAAGAESIACTDRMLSVDGADGEVAARVCNAAVAAKEELASCGLAQLRPVVIEIRPEAFGPTEHCAGLYTCGSDRILLRAPKAMARLMPEESIFAPLPPADYYDSLVVHELAHALMDQSECTGEHCDADREYVAYALQIASLSDENRALIERFHTLDRPVDVARLNAFLLFMKPDVFAAHAWAHFDDAGNGCAFVADLVNGRRSLALPLLDQ